MKLLTVKEAAEVTGLKVCELRLGAKQGRYPYIRGGSGGRNAPYYFEQGLLEKSIKAESERNMREARQAFEEAVADLEKRKKQRYVAGRIEALCHKEKAPDISPAEAERRKRLYVPE